MSAKRFMSAFQNAVGDWNEEYVFKTERIGDRDFHYLYGGIVAVTDDNDKWSLYETADKTATDTHINAWADFARGFWRKGPPDKPGLYPTRDRTENRSADRRI